MPDGNSSNLDVIHSQQQYPELEYNYTIPFFVRQETLRLIRRGELTGGEYYFARCDRAVLKNNRGHINIQKPEIIHREIFIPAAFPA